MDLRAHAAVQPATLAVGNTVRPVMRHVGVPMWHAIALLMLGCLLLIVLPFAFAVSLVLTAWLVERTVLAVNPGRPREIYLHVRYGSWTADRSRFGGESAPVEMPRGWSLGPLA